MWDLAFADDLLADRDDDKDAGKSRTEGLSSKRAPQAEHQADERDFEALNKVAELGEKNLAAIRTVHLKFRIASTGQFKPGMTPIRCSRLLDQYDLVKRPDELRDVIKSLVDEVRVDPPWSEFEMFSDRVRVRNSRAARNGESDIHLTDDKISVRWDSANSQVDIETIQNNHMSQIGIRDFWQPMTRLSLKDVSNRLIERSDETISISTKDNDQGYSTLVVIDANSGFQTKNVFRHREAGVIREQRFLGWEKGASGISFPRVVMRFDYNGGKLSFVQFLLVSEWRFNIPLSDAVFQLAAPAGSVIIDRRKGMGEEFQGRINRDVYDVTSKAQREFAAKPLDKELSPEEAMGIEDLRRIYTLPEGSILKRIGPPYPLSRKFVRRMLGDRYVSGRRPISSNLIQWNDGKFEHGTWFDGGSYNFKSLIGYFSKIEPTAIEGDAALLNREIPGDFVYRPDADAERLIERLSEIARDEFQKPIRMEFRNVERDVLIAAGTVNVTLPAGARYIAMNGGPHKGNHGEIIGRGNLKSFLADASNYIQLKVIDQVEPSDVTFEWSRRWYDLPSTKPDERFKLDPDFVLRQITEQTGITFTVETRETRILVVEEDVP